MCKIKDRLIIEKLHEAARNYVRFLEQNRPHLAFQEIHLFILKDICDSYLVSLHKMCPAIENIVNVLGIDKTKPLE